MLSEIISLLKTHNSMTLPEIAAAMEMEKSALEPMLELLEKRGKILRCEISCNTGCPGCIHKESAGLVYYKPVEQPGQQE